MSLKVIAFDVDGTLYPNPAMYLRSVPFVLRNLRLFAAFARVRLQFRKRTDGSDLRKRQVTLVASMLGMGESAAEELMRRLIYQEWEACLKGIQPYGGLRDALTALRRRGLKLALLSDFPFGLKLRYLGLEGLWDFQVCAEETGYLKPHPEPFRRLLRHFGVLPEESLFVGNHYRYDIEGAAGVGMRTAHLARRTVRGSVADLTFCAYQTLADWVARQD